MPPPRKCDWTIAKDLYCNGMTAKAVGEQMGVHPMTVQKRASRENWSKDRTMTRQGARVMTPTSISAYANAQMEIWVRGAIRLTQRITDLANRTTVKPDLKQLRDATAILESIVKSGRAMFNLDKQQDSKREQVALLVRGDVTLVTGGSTEPKPVIDVQEVGSSDQLTTNQTAKETDPLDGQPVA